MKSMELEQHKALFLDFVANFQSDVPLDKENYDLKRDHTFRVLHWAQQITQSVEGVCGRSPDCLQATHLGALYHDIGRFPQYKTWKTFADPKSTNHGRLGFRTLKAAGFLRDIPEHWRKVIQVAVALHNRREIPPHLPKDMDFALRVVRDADKLDILEVMIAHLAPDAPPNPVVTLGLSNIPEWSGDLLEMLRTGHLGAYTRMRSLHDFRLLMLSWVYDMNFPFTAQCVLQRKNWDDLVQPLPDDPAIRLALAPARAHLEALAQR